MDIMIAKSFASKKEIIGAIGRALHFPEYARDDNWDSFEECMADALKATTDHVAVHIRALPREGSAAAELIAILTDLRVEFENLSFIVGERPLGPSTAGDALQRKQA